MGFINPLITGGHHPVEPLVDFTEMYLVVHLTLSMAMTQEPIDWRYRFHINKAYVSGLCKEIYPQHMALYVTNVPPI